MAQYYVGVDVGGTTVKMGMFSDTGELLDKWEIPTRRKNNGKYILSDIVDSIEEKRETFEGNIKGIGVVIAVKVCGILIKNISKARNEICKFFANCMEWDNGTPVTLEEVKKFKLKQFVIMIKDFTKKDDLVDFFEGVAELLGTDQSDSKSAATGDTATLTAI